MQGTHSRLRACIFCLRSLHCVDFYTMNRRCFIATNLDIDPKLLDAAVKAWGFKTKKEAVNTALSELIKKKQRLGIIDLFGKIDYDPDYNYKDHRSRKKSRGI